jgi:hypothetical protein
VSFSSSIGRQLPHFDDLNPKSSRLLEISSADVFGGR